jgi:hypothetical protein
MGIGETLTYDIQTGASKPIIGYIGAPIHTCILYDVRDINTSTVQGYMGTNVLQAVQGHQYQYMGILENQYITGCQRHKYYTKGSLMCDCAA